MQKSKSSEFAQFDEATATILRADPKAIKHVTEAEKQANADERMTKKTSASDRAASEKD